MILLYGQEMIKHCGRSFRDNASHRISMLVQMDAVTYSFRNIGYVFSLVSQLKLSGFTKDSLLARWHITVLYVKASWTFHFASVKQVSDYKVQPCPWQIQKISAHYQTTFILLLLVSSLILLYSPSNFYLPFELYSSNSDFTFLILFNCCVWYITCDNKNRVRKKSLKEQLKG